jgi:hypothetical protein
MSQPQQTFQQGVGFPYGGGYQPRPQGAGYGYGGDQFRPQTSYPNYQGNSFGMGGPGMPNFGGMPGGAGYGGQQGGGMQYAGGTPGFYSPGGAGFAPQNNPSFAQGGNSFPQYGGGYPQGGFGGPTLGSSGRLTGPSGFGYPGVNSITGMNRAAPARRPYFGSQNSASSSQGARPYSNSNFYPQFA